ncbi:alanine:cation symporter family protein [Thermaerobacillus caldiproteolyticus]|uniref:alanine:cation symporter family protein n=1 Tax=Thermaerobacillus caldiproteolyticus TaxID=247480 RepID=UPI00358DD87B
MTRFLQVRHLKDMMKQMFDGCNSEEGISLFQALSLALSGRVGTGNIAGVTTAVFWMCLIAFLGAVLAFVEAALAQVYKIKQDGQFCGGPAHYIENQMVCGMIRCWDRIGHWYASSGSTSQQYCGRN